MISKELLSEVLKIDDIVHIQKEGINYLFISRANNPAVIINIYELAHKCKEWANITKGKYLSSGYNEFDKKWEAMMMQYTFPADTEPEAIFKACKWILDNNKES